MRRGMCWSLLNACIPYVEVEVLFDFDQILEKACCLVKRVCSLMDTGLYCDRLQDISGKKCGRTG